MKRARVSVNGELAGYLIEIERGKNYEFRYLDGYGGSGVSLAMPIGQQIYQYNEFPPFFDGFLPEGVMLEALLKKTKLDANDYFEQIVRVGGELVGNVTIERDV